MVHQSILFLTRFKAITTVRTDGTRSHILHAASGVSIVLPMIGRSHHGRTVFSASYFGQGLATTANRVETTVNVFRYTGRPASMANVSLWKRKKVLATSSPNHICTLYTFLVEADQRRSSTPTASCFHSLLIIRHNRDILLHGVVTSCLVRSTIVVAEMFQNHLIASF